IEANPLLADLPRMILPLSQCPTSPGQGALAVECRADDERVRQLLRPLDHPTTKNLVFRERALMAKWGGGCHQEFGASAIASDAGTVMFVAGKTPQGEAVCFTDYQFPVTQPEPGALWDGTRYRAVASPV